MSAEAKVVRWEVGDGGRGGMKIIVKSGSGEKKERRRARRRLMLVPFTCGNRRADSRHQESVNQLFCLSVVFKMAEFTFSSV